MMSSVEWCCSCSHSPGTFSLCGKKYKKTALDEAHFDEF